MVPSNHILSAQCHNPIATMESLGRHFSHLFLKTKCELLDHTRESHNDIVYGSQRKVRGLGKVELNFN